MQYNLYDFNLNMTIFIFYTWYYRAKRFLWPSLFLLNKNLHPKIRTSSSLARASIKRKREKKVEPSRGKRGDPQNTGPRGTLTARISGGPIHALTWRWGEEGRSARHMWACCCCAQQSARLLCDGHVLSPAAPRLLSSFCNTITAAFSLLPLSRKQKNI